MLQLCRSLLPLLLLLAPLPAQTQELITVEGKVLDRKASPVEFAVVSVSPGGASAVTDAAGSFRLSCACATISFIQIDHLGHAPLRISLDSIADPGDIRIMLPSTSYDLDVVEVSARPDALTSLVTTSQPVHVITEDYLARRQGGTFAGALDDLPGVATMQLGVSVAKPVIRGMSFNRILVNNHGIKQEGQQWGADHGLEVDPFDVSRVEVIKGPASLLYGSDGLGGVVNIQPPAFRGDDGNTLSWTGTYQTNNGALSNSVAWRGRKADWVYGARITHQDFGDYRVPADEFVYAGYSLPIYDNRLKNTAGNELHYSATIGRVGEWGESTLRFSSFNQDAGIFTGAIGLPRSYTLRHEGRFRDIDFPRQRNRHHMLISNSQFELGRGSLEVDLGVQWNQRRELSFPGAHGIDPSVADSDLALGLALTTRTANVRYQVEPWKGYRIVVGAQLQHGENERSGFEFLLPDYLSTQAGLFTYHVWDLSDRWIINAGMRYDRARHDVEQHLQPLYDPATRLPTDEVAERTPAFTRDFENFSGAAGVSFLPGARHNVKLNLGNSFRFPTVIELASNGVHHGNFRHERGDASLGIERGYQADLSYGYRGDLLSFELAAFYAYYRDYIYLAPSGRFSELPAGGSLWEYRQDDALFNGLELMATYDLPADFKATVVGEYVQNLNLNSKLPLPLTPAASLRADLEYRGLFSFWSALTDTYVSISGEATLAQHRVDRNERTTPGSFLLHLAFGTNLNLDRRQFRLSLRVDNLLNTAYFNHISRYRLINLPEQGRNLVLSVRIPLLTEN